MSYQGLSQKEPPVEVPARMLRLVTEAGEAIQTGLELWTRLKRIDMMTLGDELVRRHANVKRQLTTWGTYQLPELRTFIPLFWTEAKNYLSSAELAARNLVLPMDTPGGGSSSSRFKLPSLPGLSVTGLPSWAVPVGAGVLLFLLLRR